MVICHIRNTKIDYPHYPNDGMSLSEWRKFIIHVIRRAEIEYPRYPKGEILLSALSVCWILNIRFSEKKNKKRLSEGRIQIIRIIPMTEIDYPNNINLLFPQFEIRK